MKIMGLQSLSDQHLQCLAPRNLHIEDKCPPSNRGRINHFLSLILIAKERLDMLFKSDACRIDLKSISIMELMKMNLIMLDEIVRRQEVELALLRLEIKTLSGSAKKEIFHIPGF